MIQSLKTFIHSLSLTAVAACGLAGSQCILPRVAHAQMPGVLERGFASPPDATKPRCYWYWMDGRITKEGITRDLEAMRSVGIGEAYIGIIGGQAGHVPPGSVQTLSEPWWQLVEHTVREGGRIGVNIGLFNGPGWSQSGGPWVKPEQSMRHIVLREMRLHGPQHFEGALAAPDGAVQDISTLAFPAPAGDADSIGAHSPVFTSAPAGPNVARLFDGDPSTTFALRGSTPMVTVAVPAPFTARSLTITPAQQISISCELQASDDGSAYRTVRRFAIDRHKLNLNVGPVPLAPVAVSFPAVTARYFRLAFSGGGEMGEITLSSSALLESYPEKQLSKVFQDPQPPFDAYLWPPQAEAENASYSVAANTVRDISGNVSGGMLRWNVPPGDWIVLRTGAAPTGVHNGPAPPEASGPEVDKMSRTALRVHFNSYMGQLLKRMPAAERTAWKHVVADSYETGPQNWTDGFLRDFQARYGYDAVSFFPVLTGRIVGSADQSNRFLWDVRRLVADRVAGDYVGGLRDLSHENGLRVWLENYGHWGFPGEFLQYGGASDEIGGEFWATGSLGNIELRDASSAAHIYGKPATYAEAFTGGPLFTSTPWSLKKRGDWAFCQGINQFVLHVYISQPDERRPGISAGFGTEFNRHNTWFAESKSWIDYLRRCHFMLQQGKYVADVAYFIGEDTPKMSGIRQPELPDGYSFDYINADVIEHRLQVKNGRFVLPDGMSYRLIVLPDGVSMRPEMIDKLRTLVAAGGAVYGTPPDKSPSLQAFPACDEQVRRIAAKLWAGCDGTHATSAVFGQGHVFRGGSLQSALTMLGAAPDLSGVDAQQVLFIHRHAPDAEIYFLSNQTDTEQLVDPAFRVAGSAPELWHPDTGRSEALAVYQEAGGLTRVPVRLAPRGSVFVVFRGKATPGRIVRVLRDGQALIDTAPGTVSAVSGTPLELTRDASGALRALAWQAGRYTLQSASGRARALTVPALMPDIELDGPWQVCFAARSGAPAQATFNKLASWTNQSDPTIKYYSGTGSYSKSFTVPAGTLDQNHRLYLDLGDVQSLAEVIVNGKNLGTLWKMPFTLDITGAARTGANQLEVRVTNVWHNRLVGQKLQPGAFSAPGVEQPSATVMPKYGQGEPLFPSGLLGPVMLHQAASIIVR